MNGVNVIIKAVTIGKESILQVLIGTQSTVTKDVDSNSIACGNPAKILKRNVRWNGERVFGQK